MTAFVTLMALIVLLCEQPVPQIPSRPINKSGRREKRLRKAANSSYTQCILSHDVLSCTVQKSTALCAMKEAFPFGFRRLLKGPLRAAIECEKGKYTNALFAGLGSRSSRRHRCSLVLGQSSLATALEIEERNFNVANKKQQCSVFIGALIRQRGRWII